MLDYIKKLPRKLKIIGTVIFTAAFLCFLLIVNLEKGLEYAAKRFFSTTLTLEDINFSIGSLQLKKLQIFDDKERLMIDIPKVDITYSLFKMALKEINVDSPSIYVISDEDGINVKETFFKKKEEKDNNKKQSEDMVKEEINKQYKAKSLPVEKINLKNLSVNYKHKKNNKNIEKSLKEIDIFVESGRNKGITAQIFSDSNKEKIKVFYSNKNEPFYLDLKLDSIELKDYEELLIAQIPKIKKLSGQIKADAIISHYDRAGFIKLEKFELEHSDIESEIKADLDVQLNREDADLVLDFEIFGRKEHIGAVYKDSEFYSLIHLKDINEKNFTKIVPLREKFKEKNMDLSKIDIKDITLLTQYNKNDGLKINFDLLPNRVEIKGVGLESAKVNLTIKDEIKYINNSNITLKIAGMLERLSMEATVKDNIYDVIFQIKNLDRRSNLIPDFNGALKLTNNKENIIADLKSNIISLQMDYDKIQKFLRLYNEKFNFDFDRNNGKIAGSGEVDFSIYGLKNQIKYLIADDKIDLKKINIENEKNKNEKLEATGYYDLNTKDFILDYSANDLSINRLYKDQPINLSFDGEGRFKRYKNIISGLGNITELNLGYLGNINKISGKYKLNISENNELDLEFNGHVNELIYKAYKLKDMLIKISFNKGILNIKKIGNDIINISGKVNNKTKESDLDISVSNLKNSDINYDKLDFIVKSLVTKVRGELGNPSVVMNLKEADAFINDKIIKISGNIKISDKKIDISNFLLNNNSIKGNYDINSKKYQADILIDDNLKNYLKGDELNYKIKGLASLNGNGGVLISNLQLNGAGKLKDTKLPNLKLVADYSAKNYSDGLLNLKEFSLKNVLGKELLNLVGNINLKDKNIDISFNEAIELADLKEYIKSDDFKGKLHLNGGIKGTIDKPLYNIALDSEKLVIKNQEISEIKYKLNGDKDSLNIKASSFVYLGSKILSSGNYDIVNKKYNFNIKPEKEINLEKIANVLKFKKITNTKGLVNFNIGYSNNGLNGYIKTNGVFLNDEKGYINISNLNTDIKIKDNEIKIKNFMSKVNEGDFKIDGYVKIPKDLKNIPDSLDYLLNLNLEHLKYQREDIGNLELSSHLNFNNQKVQGEVILERGRIHDIPNDYKSLWSMIKKKLSRKEENKIEKVATEKDSSEKKQQKILEKFDYIDLKFFTKEPVILDLDDFNIAVGELKGKLVADLAVKGEKGKFYLEGNTEIENGYMYVNTNKFILDRALVAFNDRKSYLPDVNPDIFVDTTVNMDGEDINFSINGRKDKLVYKLKTENGRVSGNLNSLLINKNGGITLSENTNEAFVKFMKNIIAGQIVQAIFGPITKVAKKTLGMSKLVLKPEVSVYNVESKNIEMNKAWRDTEIYDFGLKLEADKSLYKDSVYLYGNAKLFGSNKSSVVNTDIQKNGVQEYDVGLEYRTKDDKIFGVGVGTVANKYANKDLNQHKRNYHIDFKLKKKYDNFSEIFSF